MLPSDAVRGLVYMLMPNDPTSNTPDAIVRTAEEERDEDDIRRGREPTRGGGSESSLVRR